MQLHTSHEEADEGQNSLAGSSWHGACGFVHLGCQDDSSHNLADGHLNASLDQQCLAAKPAPQARRFSLFLLGSCWGHVGVMRKCLFDD